MDDLVEAFRVFDKMKNGTVPADDVRHYLTTLGEKMSEEEVEDMLKLADIDQEGNIDYVKFSKVLMA